MKLGETLRNIWKAVTEPLAAPSNLMSTKEYRRIRKEVSEATGFEVHAELYTPMAFGRYGGTHYVYNLVNDLRRNAGLVIPEGTPQAKIEEGIDAFVAAAQKAELKIGREDVCFYEKKADYPRRMKLTP